jgi:hypothetical protein
VSRHIVHMHVHLYIHVYDDLSSHTNVHSRSKEQLGTYIHTTILCCVSYHCVTDHTLLYSMICRKRTYALPTTSAARSRNFNCKPERLWFRYMFVHGLSMNHVGGYCCDFQERTLESKCLGKSHHLHLGYNVVEKY